MSNLKFISSEEFLSRSVIIESTRLNSTGKHTNSHGGALFLGHMENKNEVNIFLAKMKDCGVVVECEDNPVQENYASTIRLTFTNPGNMLNAMSWIMSYHPDELHYIDNKTCCLWWD